MSDSKLYRQTFHIPDRALAQKFDAELARLGAAGKGVAEWRAGGLPHFRLPIETADLPAIEAAARALCSGASDVIVFGIGGSSLGAQALAQIAGWGTPAYRSAGGQPMVHIVENLDGATLDGLLARLDLARTKVLAISKSGSTTETLSQTMIAIAAFERAGLGAGLKDRFTMVAEPGANALRTLGETIGCRVYDHDPALGGRFSVLSLVGLIPAACIGLNIAEVRRGAAQTLEALGGNDAPFAQGAALSVAAAQTGLQSHVMWAYADRLERFVMWWRQLWGESLGKGGHGTTPVRALGPVDQHSQLQLYLDGPRDKLWTVMTIGGEGESPVPPEWANKIGQPLLAGKAPRSIVNAQARATVETLVRAGRTVRTFHVPTLNERGMGALMMHFILETLYAARLLNVDPFDQPAVELGKVLTRQFLSEGGA
jgi:glucose-6-phosphate isomerase